MKYSFCFNIWVTHSYSLLFSPQTNFLLNFKCMLYVNNYLFIGFDTGYYLKTLQQLQHLKVFDYAFTNFYNNEYIHNGVSKIHRLQFTYLTFTKRRFNLKSYIIYKLNELFRGWVVISFKISTKHNIL